MAKLIKVINEGGRIGADAIRYSDRVSIRVWLHFFGYSWETILSKSQLKTKPTEGGEKK